MSLPPPLRLLLVCPKCQGDLTEKESPDRLVCLKCGRVYPLRDGIAVLMEERWGGALEERENL